MEINKFTIKQKDINFLENFVAENKIKKILEFGAGLSTEVFLKYSCIIDSFEFKEKYYQEYRDKFSSNANCSIHFKEEVNDINFGGYSLKKSYDLCFVDGPYGQSFKKYSRLPQLLFALTKSKFVMLHDRSRTKEMNSLALLANELNCSIDISHNCKIALIQPPSIIEFSKIEEIHEKIKSENE